jgi:hypothetical protein
MRPKGDVGHPANLHEAPEHLKWGRDENKMHFLAGLQVSNLHKPISEKYLLRILRPVAWGG